MQNISELPDRKDRVWFLVEKSIRPSLRANGWSEQDADTITGNVRARCAGMPVIFPSTLPPDGAAVHKGEEAAHEIGRVIHGYLSSGGKKIEKF